MFEMGYRTENLTFASSESSDFLFDVAEADLSRSCILVTGGSSKFGVVDLLISLSVTVGISIKQKVQGV